MTPWIIAICIAAILIKSAHGAQQKAAESITVEGTTLGVKLAVFLSVASMAFILAAVILAGK